jgi:hypothetical protein
MTGNVFKKGVVSFGSPAKRVWREIRHRYPAGGTIRNMSDFVRDGIIPSGSPVAYDASTKSIAVIKYTDISAASTAEAIAALGINGYLQEDVVLDSTGGGGVPDAATGTVVYAGELYEYMYPADVVAVLKQVTTTPQIVFVQ